MIKGSAGARRRRLITHSLALWVWAFAVWVLLTWTLTTEQLLVGAVIATAVAMVFAPLGPVARPWRLLDPEVLWRLAVLAATALVSALVGALLSLGQDDLKRLLAYDTAGLLPG